MILPDFKLLIIHLCTFFSCSLYLRKTPSKRGPHNLLSVSAFTKALQQSGKLSGR